MEITREELEKIANLSKLHLDEQHEIAYQKDLTNIVNMVSQIQKADTDQIEPLFNPLDAVQRLREDFVTEVDTSKVLQNLAPASEANLYLVPKVVDNPT